ncbi:ankyrin repeat domain-containing protein [Spiroplasma endosymbiont of Dilophus febrilis]
MLPQEFQEQLLTIKKEFENYFKYSIDELTRLKVKILELQQGLDISDEKEQLNNYMHRIDYRMKALTINYQAEVQKEIFNRLEQLINRGDILAIEQFLQNTPIDLNINASMFINKKIENWFQKIDFHKTLAVLEILINYGFNVNVWNNDGETPLHIAVRKEWLALIQLLLDNGANVNAGTVYVDDSDLESETDDANLNVGDINIDDSYLEDEHNTALHYAVKSKNIAVIE